ncbi:DUF5665 domain-containing protein [Gymnodinialimonas sp. 2305UL16-5]|uniref:DUF5665 domain-containing protein n=1 Tax=Gymnodinialimonas mytili TaxID=3126503 RepID=UPI0030A9840B
MRRRKTPQSTDADQVKSLEAEVHALQSELALMRQHKMFLLYQSVPKVLLFKAAQGAAVGLGTVLGATVLLSLMVWALSQIEFIPIIGEWSVSLAEEIQAIISEAE